MNSLQELYDAKVGASVFDAHDPIPEWLIEHITHPYCLTTQPFAQWVLWKLRDPKIAENKIVYKASQDDQRITLICMYDFQGRVYNVEL